MNEKTRELNHVINMMYRQLGKDLFDDLKKDKVNIRKYKNQSRHIDNVIKAMRSIEISTDKMHDEDMKIIKSPEPNEEGLFHFKFCLSCNAGNNPEATHCIRCHEPLS